MRDCTNLSGKNLSAKADKYSHFLPQNPKIGVILSSLVHFAKVLFECTGFQFARVAYTYVFFIGLLDLAYF